MILVKNFACNGAYFKLYPVSNWELMEIFQLRSNV